MKGMFEKCTKLVLDCTVWNGKLGSVTEHSNFSYNAPGVILPTWININGKMLHSLLFILRVKRNSITDINKPVGGIYVLFKKRI